MTTSQFRGTAKIERAAEAKGINGMECDVIWSLQIVANAVLFIRAPIYDSFIDRNGKSFRRCHFSVFFSQLAFIAFSPIEQCRNSLDRASSEAVIN